jgi:hypothetical protein
MYSVCELETRKSSALPLQPWFPTSGGLTRVAGRKRPQLRCVTHTHGGLTPAALVNVRSCIAKIVFSPTNVRTAPRAGGVSPPWSAFRTRVRTPKFTALPLQPWFPTSAQLTRVAGRKRPQLQLRYSHPRRADARRSCECAFVHRKNRHFSPTVHREPRAGGVSPPWVRYCDSTGVREHTAGSLPRLCGSVPASALP